MTDISKAIAAKQSQLTQLQADLDALQRAIITIGSKTPAKKRKRRGKMSAAARKALSQETEGALGQEEGCCENNAHEDTAHNVGCSAESRSQADEGVLGGEAEGEEVVPIAQQGERAAPAGEHERAVAG